MAKSTPTVLYVTAGTRDEAMMIGRTLVEERLAACANVLPAVTAIYWWNGEVQDEGEAVLIVKTRADLVAETTRRIRTLHSYDCPCVLAFDVADGDADFLDWILKETRQPTIKK